MKIKTKRNYVAPSIKQVLLMPKIPMLVGSQPAKSSTEDIESEEVFEW